jgi:hypothetical protein
LANILGNFAGRLAGSAAQQSTDAIFVEPADIVEIPDATLDRRAQNIDFLFVTPVTTTRRKCDQREGSTGAVRAVSFAFTNKSHLCNGLNLRSHGGRGVRTPFSEQSR